MDSIEVRALRWAAGSDTGSSSKAILAVMTGARMPSHHDYPRDSGDLGRCIRLLDAVPEWRERIALMRGVGPEWGALCERWADLELLYRNNDYAGVRELIKQLTSPIRANDPNVVRFGDGELIFGGRKAADD